MFFLRRNQENDLHKQELKSVPFGCFFHIFTVANQLPGFFISRLANVEDFLNVNVFFNCKCEYKQFFI